LVAASEAPIGMRKARGNRAFLTSTSGGGGN
jgi:hypothetical protein